MDSLFAFYHKQWWCYRKLLNRCKFYNALFNGLALLLMAAGMIAGPILNNSTLVACITSQTQPDVHNFASSGCYG